MVFKRKLCPIMTAFIILNKKLTVIRPQKKTGVFKSAIYRLKHTNIEDFKAKDSCPKRKRIQEVGNGSLFNVIFIIEEE